VPEGGFAGSQERIFAGIPAEEVRRFGVCGVVLAGLPNFMEKIGAWLIGAAMEIELEATLFLSRGIDQRAKFGFEKQILAFAGAQENDTGNSAFGEFLNFFAM
jgi:hypothetical protein